MIIIISIYHPWRWVKIKYGFSQHFRAFDFRFHDGSKALPSFTYIPELETVFQFFALWYDVVCCADSGGVDV